MFNIKWQKSGTINELELAILDGAVDAQKKHESMTNGWWLSHGPESFLQVSIAQHVHKATNHAVYIDCSIKKIRSDMDCGSGRPPANGSERPDISVWHKSDNSLRAGIEIKRAYHCAPVKKDARRLTRWLSHESGPRAGYVLVYSESKGRNCIRTLERRFEAWSDDIGWSLKGSAIDRDQDEEGWTWGVCLLRDQ